MYVFPHNTPDNSNTLRSPPHQQQLHLFLIDFDALFPSSLWFIPLRPFFIHDPLHIDDFQQAFTIFITSLPAQPDTSAEQMKRSMSQSCLMEDVQKQRWEKANIGKEYIKSRGSESFFYHTSLRKDMKMEGESNAYLLSAKKFISFSDLMIKLSQSYYNFIGQSVRVFEKHFYRQGKQYLRFNEAVHSTNEFIQFLIAVITLLFIKKQFFQNKENHVFTKDNLQSLVGVILFERLKVYQRIEGALLRERPMLIEQFRAKMLILQHKTISFFSVPEQFYLTKKSIKDEDIKTSYSDNTDFIPYQKSILKFPQLASKRSPVGKLKVLVEITEDIIDEISLFYQRIGQTCPTMEPDALLPIFIFCLVRSQHHEAVMDNVLIKQFMPRICGHSISGYYAVNLQAAIEFVMQSDV